MSEQEENEKSFILRQLYQNYQQNIDHTNKKDLLGSLSHTILDSHLKQLEADDLVIQEGSTVQITQRGISKIEESCSCD